eukprot:g1061.t1
MRLFVSDCNSRTYPIVVDRDAMIRSVLYEIFQNHGKFYTASKKSFRLDFGGKTLDERLLLSDYNVQEDSVLHLLPSLKGGIGGYTTFSKEGTALCLTFFSFSCVAMAFAVFLVGISITNPTIADVYGVDWAAMNETWMDICAFILLILTCLGLYGIKYDNKCIMFVFNLLLFIVIVAQVGLLLNIASQTAVTYSDEFQESCLREVVESSEEYVPIENYATLSPECIAYLTDETRQSLYRWWGNMHAASEDTDTLGIMIMIQREGNCCGFGPPQGCYYDRIPPLSSRTPYEFKNGRCGIKKSWYPSSAYCNMVSLDKEETLFPAGCRFDLPVPQCAERVPKPDIGCALEIQKYVIGRTSPITGALSFLVILETICFIMSLNYYFKRKNTDALPPRGWKIEFDDDDWNE